MTWLLLRGLTRESRHWGEFTQQFASATGDEVLPLDFPGSGVLCADASPSSVSGLVDALRCQVATRGIELPVNVLAMSLGGMVATDWAQRYPQDIARVVLINTSMRPFSSMTQRLRQRNWLSLAKIAFTWNNSNKVEQHETAIHRLTCRQAQHLGSDIAMWSHIRRSARVKASNAFRQLFAAARYACLPEPPPSQLLVLSAKGDDLVNPACSTQLATAWHLPHLQHPWAGHDLPHDDGSWVCEQVLTWLAAKK